MPHFTLQFGPDGPRLTAYVGVSGPREQAMLQAGQALPPLVQVRALVDTGADGTCVDPTVLQRLGLTPRGTALVVTPTTGQTPHAHAHGRPLP